MEKMFELATRKRLRFPHKGQSTVEDLWELPVKELDNIYKVLNSKKKQNSEDSLLKTVSKTAEEEILELQIEIVKNIVSTKIEEAKQKTEAAEKKTRQDKIKEILASRNEEKYLAMSDEELQKLLEE